MIIIAGTGFTSNEGLKVSAEESTEACSKCKGQRAKTHKGLLTSFFTTGTLKVRLSAAERKDREGWYSSSKSDIHGGGVPETTL